MCSVALTPVGFPPQCLGCVWLLGRRLDTEPPLSWVLAPTAAVQGDNQGPSSSAAPFPLAHVHPASTLLLPEAYFLSIPINPSADVSRTALKVGLQKSGNSEMCRGAAKAPRSPALITANGQKELYDDLSHCHLRNDLAAILPLVPLLTCHPSLTSVPLLERRAQRRDRCVQCTPWVFSWQKQVFPFLSLLNMHPAAGARVGWGGGGGGLCFQEARASKQLIPNHCPSATRNGASLFQDLLCFGTFWHFHCPHESWG